MCRILSVVVIILGWASHQFDEWAMSLIFTTTGLFLTICNSIFIEDEDSRIKLTFSATLVDLLIAAMGCLVLVSNF